MNREQVKTSVIVAGMASWMTATAISQLPDTRFDRLLIRRSIGLPIPNWRFFGPNPGVKDVHLLYRDLDESGNPGEWREVEIASERRWYALAWNARNRAPKALFDALQAINAHAVALGGKVELVSRTFGYLFLAQYIQRHLPHEEQATATQFMLVESHLTDTNTRTIEPAFASAPLPFGREPSHHPAPPSG